MKNTYLLPIAALFISVTTFAQKDELKAAEKALKSGNSAEAKSTLTKVEALLSSADDAQKAQYYFLKGKTLLDLATKKVDVSSNLVEASKAINTLFDVEKASKKSKYTTDATLLFADVKKKLTDLAIEDTNNKNFKESADKLYQVYTMDKKDSIMLYYAAATALNAQDNDKALEYYTLLKNINYSGKATNILATSKISDKEDGFNTIAERDKAVKIGTHTKPRLEQIPSKRAEVAKNIALIYIGKNNIPEAKKAISDARKVNPDDVSLISSEADLYLKTEDYATYKKLITEVIAKNPNDADLYYNLGVISTKAKNGQAEAEKYYMKAIEIDPKYKNAYMNLTILKLEGEKAIVEAMNKLGTSAADTKKYDVLKAQRQDLYRSVIPYLEKAYELFAGDADIKTTLLNVYNALDMTEKFKALKKS
jgi:tetratricopeptide (TPR) repeat protein